ncbi:hypothetical protein BXZ70DRAFT_893167 [Cristinia sonorae]|uniref:Erythromycin esterase n=1 Tax=Cristinia sonorae TaxID=1940300 RepID=A0A8K0UPS5_9AGAR|nr:hypothetical protein BXZ70DRAFT_893167 [Cristinia sonorae]
MTITELNSPLSTHIRPLSFHRSAYDPLLDAIGNAQIVLIGDGSHGTYEFYAHRANITQRLVDEKGFTVVALEADWPDAFRINRYIHGGHRLQRHKDTARSCLGEFERFPKWMWKNEVMPQFIDFLKTFNAEVMKSTGNAANQVSVYGLDLYSLHRSAEQVVNYLERVDREAAKAARAKYNCFERYGEDTTRYAFEAQFGLSKTCQQEVIQNLQNLVRNHRQYIEEQVAAGAADDHPAYEQFMAEMNALLVRDAEEYYRTMMQEDTKSWNIRDDHFARALVEIVRHLGSSAPDDSTQKDAKVVVWAHNSHVGDARATDMGRKRGEINVGQRCRELFGADNVFTIGFLTNRGTVTAAFEWDEPPLTRTLNPPIAQSIEKLFDETANDDCFVIMHRIEDLPDGSARKVEVNQELTRFLNRPRYQRFIGVLYKSATEIPSHYARCMVADQYDAVAHIKVSRGIQPLEPEDVDKGLTRGELDETYPFGE